MCVHDTIHQHIHMSDIKILIGSCLYVDDSWLIQPYGSNKMASDRSKVTVFEKPHIPSIPVPSVIEIQRQWFKATIHTHTRITST